MKAIICTTYGSPEVLQLKEVAKPVPGDNEILVKVSATSVTAPDIRLRSATVPLSFWLPAHFIYGWSKPRKAILGTVVAGSVEAVGNAVKHWKKGDQIYAYDITRFRTYAEYTCLPENSAIAFKPSTLPYEEAVAIPYGGIIALHLVNALNLRRKMSVDNSCVED
jgi:NADPH:quinone reductase-like Zn-dependent oxidoreductase